MRGYHGDRGSHPRPARFADQQHMDVGPAARASYLLGSGEAFSTEPRFCAPRAGLGHLSPEGPLSLSEGPSTGPEGGPGGAGVGGGSSTFPRMYPGQGPFDTCEDCVGHPQGKGAPRLPPTLLDQFEKQLPVQQDGFHTLPYQRGPAGAGAGPGPGSGTTPEARSESPSRIRHLVHSVQKLFAKSHSLEAPGKRDYNGPKAEGRGGSGGDSYPGPGSGGLHTSQHHHHHHHHHQSRHGKRSKSKDRKGDGRQQAKAAGWWSSDDNLDSDSGFLAGGRPPGEPGGPFCLEAPDGSYRDLSFKGRSGGSEGRCLACTGMSMSLDGQSVKRSAWHTMMVSQGRDGYPGAGPGKGLLGPEAKAKARTYHYLQVPQDDWGGYPTGGKDGEIPCRRMRSGSYIKAMGDEESGDSDGSPKTSPKAVARRFTTRRSSSVDQARINCCVPPRIHPRSSIPGYSRSLTTGQLSEELNQQLEAVCGSVFGELESQAVDALDLPGCFRMRSHSYLRAIQAGCSQDDDCLPLLSTPASVSGRPGSSFNFRKAPPPIPPGSQAPPRISITAQSSTDSAHESFTAAEGPARRCSSADGLDGPAMGARTLELAPVSPRASPKPPTLIIKTIPGREELRSLARQRKWRPSIGVQVETISDSDTENRSRREFHSIGVQVEEDKRRARFKRSNSVTAGVQADLELEGLAGLATVATEDKALQFGRSFQRHASEPQPGPRAPTYSVFRTVHTQGQWAYREGYPLPYEPPATDGSPGPAPAPTPGPGSGRRDSWMERGSRSLPDSGRTSPSPRDGEWFIKMLRAEVEKLEHWCQQMEHEAEDYELPEEILEKIRSAVGSTQLLLSQKVQQFFRLCQQSMDPTAFPVPTFQDLAGFWDLLQLSIEDVTLKFLELQQLKANSWKLLEPKEEKKVPPPIPKKPLRGRGVPVKERSLDSVDRQRQEARKRLLAAKRAASFRHSSATESADSIEIYIPEAQTRL
ncbi:disks large-associated protein 3 [Monodon monoceros]|uniref:DLG associated protein 3 n=2 Tax=Monodon monoceros TaxID=40151 RepID=A0A8C6F671_MONMO|nr:disks large-associated protein 3 [Monodon monoceros]